MVPQPNRLVVPLVLCILLAPPVAAQEEGVFEGSPTDLLPLQVGNQWTHIHEYSNSSYDQSWMWDQNPEIRKLFEIPGYPYDNSGIPPDSLRYEEREVTIEITHTEWIDGLEYFVFSRADYDWPPLPNLFWAGQKVRLSDEGVLLFRWNGQDVPLYDLNFQHPGRYSIPAYPIREDLVTKLDVWRQRRLEGQIQISFSVQPEINLPDDISLYIGIAILPGYGLFCTEHYYITTDFGGFGFPPWSEPHLFFLNHLGYPISAIISGEAVSYKQASRGDFNTHVQSSSWGQLKRMFRPR